ncbi:hypothetical protein PoB_003523100 [Plakobranchus ocellatus]|uniref:Uncharacterized protein n=1 Tax=Plakobranchus ocellatus TaxID=259542 RepID=A0AAV4AC58_9GAST|nr:hypothetical protein PoB_003523100 [Plakobranchus ocellatus]
MAKKKGVEGVCEGDMRGKHASKANKIDDERENIRAHISSFPKTDSHYCRKNTKRQYFGADLNLHTLYYLNKEKAETDGRKLASLSSYKNVFYNEFNLGFHKRLKDSTWCTDLDDNRPDIQISFVVIAVLLGSVPSNGLSGCWFSEDLPNCRTLCFPRGLVYACREPVNKTCHHQDYKYMDRNYEYTCRANYYSSWWEKRCPGCERGRQCYQLGSVAIFHYTQCICKRRLCIDHGGFKMFVPITSEDPPGCSDDNYCYSVGSEVSKHRSNFCERIRCVNQNGNIKFVHVGWECLYGKACYKMYRELTFQSHCVTMLCVPKDEQMRRARYRLRTLPAQFIVYKHDCKDLNGECVPKNTAFSVIRNGIREDNCYCNVAELPYSSLAQKVKAFRFHQRTFCYGNSF